MEKRFCKAKNGQIRDEKRSWRTSISFVKRSRMFPLLANIYKMMEMIVGTQGQRMDKVIIEVF